MESPFPIGEYSIFSKRRRDQENLRSVPPFQADLLISVEILGLPDSFKGQERVPRFPERSATRWE
jgi:hypothetical protein